jgi:low molecular weight protein-tyrosine phosphatase
MVCMGNICRSPMAEIVAQTLLAQSGHPDLAGFESFGTSAYHVGDDADPQALAALSRRGWPSGRHRARQITIADLPRLDLVLCADRRNVAHIQRLGDPGAEPGKVRLLRSFDPDAGRGNDELPDPWGLPDSAFDHCLELIERACRGLVAFLVRPRS